MVSVEMLKEETGKYPLCVPQGGMRTWGWGGADEVVGTVVGEAPLD